MSRFRQSILPQLCCCVVLLFLLKHYPSVERRPGVEQVRTSPELISQPSSQGSCPGVPTCLPCSDLSDDFAFVAKQKEKSLGANASLYVHHITGIIITLPLPTDALLAELYRTQYSGQASLHIDHPRPVSQVNFILSAAPDFCPQRVVELGCGGGYLLHRLITVFRSCIKEVWCLEPDPDMHAAATKNMAGFDGVKFELRHSTKLVDVVPENYFDLIVSSHAIEHAPNPCKTLGTQALQLVRKGGYAFHEIPHQDESALRSGKQRGSLHLTFWSKMSVRSIARVTGWRVISAANYDTYDKASEHGQWVRAMLQRPAR